MVSDLLQGETGINEVACACVSERMRAEAFSGRDDSGESGAYHVCQCRRGKRTKGGLNREKQDPTVASRPAVAKVTRDCVADRRIQRVCVLTATLGPHNADRFLHPVDTVEPQTAQFS